MLNFTLDLKDLVIAARRIADALERISPPILLETLATQNKKDRKIIRYGRGEERWAKEQFQDLVKPRGLAPAEERRLVEEMYSEWAQAMDQENIDH